MSITKYKSPGWRQLKELNVKEMKLIALNMLFVAIIIITSIIVTIADNNIAAIILMVIAIPLGIWSFVNLILFIIIKVKQFTEWGTISKKEQDENQTIFIFLIISIFFSFIFTIILFFTFKNIQIADEDEEKENIEISDESLPNNTNVEKTLDIKASEKNIYSELKELKELLDKNLISQEEFDTMKAKILAT